MPRQAPYLHRRGHALEFRIAVPVALRPIVGQRELTKALPTSNRRQAEPLALECAACAKRVFGELRTAMAAPDETKLKDLTRDIRHRLKMDDLRNQHEGELLAKDRQHRQELKQAVLKAENDALRSVLTGFHAPAAPTSPPTSASAPTPPTTPTKPRALHKLSEAVPEWKRIKNPAVSTVEVYEATVRKFEKLFPTLHIEEIEKGHVIDFVEWLKDQGKNPKTVEKEHGVVRALLSIAEYVRWIDGGNPASKIILPPTSKAKPVRSYTPEECKVIFNSPVFTAGERPTGCMGETAYWMPLLMLFTGARREELCQLTTDRVKVSEGIHFLAIDTIEEEGRLKTEESKRSVPIHTHLIQIGFLDFVQDRIKAGGGQLFAELKPNKRGQYGAKFDDWWGKYIRETVGLTDERISPAHSFRHSFISECRRLGFREDYERALVGHTSESSKRDAHDGYGEHHLPALAAELNRIDFRGLNLAHLYKL